MGGTSAKVDNLMIKNWAWANEYESRQRIFFLFNSYKKTSDIVVRGKWESSPEGRMYAWALHYPTILSSSTETMYRIYYLTRNYKWSL